MTVAKTKRFAVPRITSGSGEGENGFALHDSAHPRYLKIFLFWDYNGYRCDDIHVLHLPQSTGCRLKPFKIPTENPKSSRPGQKCPTRFRRVILWRVSLLTWSVFFLCAGCTQNFLEKFFFLAFLKEYGAKDPSYYTLSLRRALSLTPRDIRNHLVMPFYVSSYVVCHIR